MNAASAIPGLVRRIVLDGDWQDAPLVLADALEEIGECRAARLLRIRRNSLVYRLAGSERVIEELEDVNVRKRWIIWRARSIDVFNLYVASRFAPEFVPRLLCHPNCLDALDAKAWELRILPDPAGVQPAT